MTAAVALPLEKTLFIDIETAPLWRSVGEMGEGENILVEYWEKRYDKYREADKSVDDYFLEKAAIHAIYGRVVCIGLGWLGQKNGAWTWRETVLHDLNEKQLLQNFLDIWTKYFLPSPGRSEVTTLCGHNLLNFDYVFLGRRLLINGFPLPEPWLTTLNDPIWKSQNFRLRDTMQMWSMRESGGGSYISLEVLAHILGIPFRKSLSHHEIRDRFFQWQDTGEVSHFQPVLDYCLEDVRTTAKIYLRLMNRPDLIPHITPPTSNPTDPTTL